MNDFSSSASSTVLFRCVANYCLIPTGCVKLIHTWKIIPTGVCQTVIHTMEDNTYWGVSNCDTYMEDNTYWGMSNCDTYMEDNTYWGVLKQ